ncbi:hypothetical protein GE21DRAFT_9383 [Neurospora crassa]|uniref:Uncharacterized protein n=1 Tax=Neurospora crassa (strain ATCC 24698 / 74-OR23-1A / CBS 708.71 / DSM 1257 / FGSC 987) TaxID=367110 RepID=V5IL33_NEUCR|nr:hypothetical protein NCU17127 [Neurospora crassa OR74A]ESA42292.1 hypothetical protein NCU17127 [Neurospora crassa OR74A]KHE87509.1 hypothetical protein GE21DRAFT_9383 [Neurospora crassa]|eukprot:XP_011395101.1 hypothetical protein NCU17127 [Neurospora crassa OR74A]
MRAPTTWMIQSVSIAHHLSAGRTEPLPSPWALVRIRLELGDYCSDRQLHLGGVTASTTTEAEEEHVIPTSGLLSASSVEYLPMLLTSFVLKWTTLLY